MNFKIFLLDYYDLLSLGFGLGLGFYKNNKREFELEIYSL